MEFSEYRNELLKDPKVKKAYDALAPEYDVIHALIDARNRHGITMRKLAKKTGIKRSKLRKLETGNYNPTLKFLKKLQQDLESSYILALDNKFCKTKKVSNLVTY